MPFEQDISVNYQNETESQPGLQCKIRFKWRPKKMAPKLPRKGAPIPPKQWLEFIELPPGTPSLMRRARTARRNDRSFCAASERGNEKEGRAVRVRPPSTLQRLLCFVCAAFATAPGEEEGGTTQSSSRSGPLDGGRAIGRGYL